MSSTLSVRSVVASVFCVLDQYASERFGRLRSMRGEGACGVSPSTQLSLVLPQCRCTYSIMPGVLLLFYLHLVYVKVVNSESCQLRKSSTQKVVNSESHRLRKSSTQKVIDSESHRHSVLLLLSIYPFCIILSSSLWPT
jgi:hypothetical protein